MEERIYRISAEVIGQEKDNSHLDRNDADVTCDGFAVIGTHEDGCALWLHHVTVMDLAKAMATNADLTNAARLAIALRAIKRDAETDDEGGDLGGAEDIIAKALRNLTRE